MKKNADMPAMPQSATNEGYGCNYTENFNGEVPTGLTKREMFAMNIMSNLCGLSLDDSAKMLNVTGMGDSGELNSRLAVEYADALLKELDK